MRKIFSSARLRYVVSMRSCCHAVIILPLEERETTEATEQGGDVLMTVPIRLACSMYLMCNTEHHATKMQIQAQLERLDAVSKPPKTRDSAASGMYETSRHPDGSIVAMCRLRHT